ncbi:ArsR/SmtB family transcription factor [Streptacidiphilus monticola]|uniref:ArsR/SmtB family transcription factor n=1 Tax=Streptacidiphilus monticola TaxID=2161674 RepID=A0ABW1G7F1_9ACTN
MSSEERPERPHRKLTDPKAMRAIAHPTRLAILEALARREPLTATEVSEMVGESPTNCAFHLRTLAKYGFVEEAEGGAGRRRPWRRAHIGFGYDENALEEPESRIAAGVLTSVLWEQWLAKIARVNALRGSFPEEWRKVTGGSQSVFWLTPDEAAAFEEELTAMLFRYRERLEDPSLRPAGSFPIELVQFTFPFDATRTEGD